MDRKRLAVLATLVLIVGTVAFVSAILEPVHAFNCKIVSCPAPACEANEHLQVPPGQCCPVCVPN